MKKCFMMEPKQKATWAEIDVGSLVTPDFVKACIRCDQYFSFKLFVKKNIYELLMIASSCRVVMCCMRLGDCMLARYDNIDLQYFLTKTIFFLQGGYRIVEQASKYQRHLRSVPG